MALEIFLNNGSGPHNHHTKFEIILIYCWFYKNPKSKWFSHLDLYGSWQKHANHNTNLWKNLLFYKIRNILGKIKLGVVIAWTISIVKKNSVAIATCLEEFDFLAPISQRVYSHMKVDTIITILLSIATWHEFRSEKNVSYLIEASATQITHVKLTSPISVCSALFHSVELACPRSYVLFLIHSWHFTLTGAVFLLATIMVCRDSQKEPQTVFQLNYMYITVSVGWVVLIT